MGPLLRSGMVMCEPIELSFGVVSGVGPGMGVNVLQGEGGDFGEFLSYWFGWCIVKQKCIRLVFEKLTVFPYGQEMSFHCQALRSGAIGCNPQGSANPHFLQRGIS